MLDHIRHQLATISDTADQLAELLADADPESVAPLVIARATVALDQARSTLSDVADKLASHASPRRDGQSRPGEWSGNPRK